MRKHIFICVMFSGIILLTGCNLLDTRDPETPTGISGNGWVFPSTPSKVLSNLSNAIGIRSSTEYVRCLTGDSLTLGVFSFIPDDETASAFPDRFIYWDYDRERKFAESLLSPSVLPNDSISNLSFEIEREVLSSDSAEISASYSLTVNHVIDQVAREFRGQASFNMRKNSEGAWMILVWTDSRVSGFDCWSDLKAAF